jgi:hypothetical protein
MADRTCPNCGFFDRWQGDETGLCRRYAPRPLVYFRGRDETAVSDRNYIEFPIWPWVTPDDWCGEWTSAASA